VELFTGNNISGEKPSATGIAVFLVRKDLGY
jgi:hypothetical protein